MPASGLLLAARVASLNLCTDEYLLLLARPQEVTSVSFLSRDRRESPLWRLAGRHPANNGSIEAVLRHRPTMLLTMGDGGRASGLIARRMGMRTVDLKPNESPADVAGNLRTVATALGRPESARPWLDRLARVMRSRPTAAKDTIWLSAGGSSLGPRSPGAQWLRLAGLRQRALGSDKATLEDLLVRPPQVLVETDYRRGEASLGNRWLGHPVIRNVKAVRLRVDRRAAHCMGPLMIGEVERLRTELR